MSAGGLFRSAPPDVAIEIDADHVTAARAVWRGASASIAAHAIERLPAGAVAPSLTVSNIPDPAVVGRAISQALSRLGRRTRRVALVVPDTVAKVSLIRFETLPPRRADLQELVRWQMKKTAPFPLEQAVVSFTPGVRPREGGQEFVVSVARQDVIEEYQRACTLAGVHAGLVDLATFSVVNGVLGGGAVPIGDWLLVHVTPGYTTLAVLRDEDLIFYRSRPEGVEGTLADVVHQTAMYYEDRLKGPGFSRVLLAGGAMVPGGVDSLRGHLEDRLELPVEAVDPRTTASLGDRAAASPDLLDALAPLIGILAREQKAA